jgi:tRNA(Ile)-lysidine synthase
LIRPLLFAQSAEIVAFCKNNGLAFRTDSTNIDTDILRNKLRHQIIPLFEEMNPAFFQTMQSNMALLREVNEVFTSEVDRFKEAVVACEQGAVLISLSLLSNHPHKKSLLFEILRPYGFKGAVMDSILNGLDGIPGKQYFSETHRLVRDRYNLILVEREAQTQPVFYIQAGEFAITAPLALAIRFFDRTPEFKYSTHPKVAHFDADMIDFPLEIRGWKTGDQFQPLGMTQSKKLSDFFIDEKFTLIDKEKSWLLISNNDIIWVVGKRLDNRFKVTSKTKHVLEICTEGD